MLKSSSVIPAHYHVVAGIKNTGQDLLVRLLLVLGADQLLVGVAQLQIRYAGIVPLHQGHAQFVQRRDDHQSRTARQYGTGRILRKPGVVVDLAHGQGPGLLTARKFVADTAHRSAHRRLDIDRHWTFQFRARFDWIVKGTALCTGAVRKDTQGNEARGYFLTSIQHPNFKLPLSEVVADTLPLLV